MSSNQRVVALRRVRASTPPCSASGLSRCACRWRCWRIGGGPPSLCQGITGQRSISSRRSYLWHQPRAVHRRRLSLCLDCCHRQHPLPAVRLPERLAPLPPTGVRIHPSTPLPRTSKAARQERRPLCFCPNAARHPPQSKGMVGAEQRCPMVRGKSSHG